MPFFKFLLAITIILLLNHILYFPLQLDAVPVLGSFLRKNQRALKLATLTLLDTFVKNYGSALNTALLNAVSFSIINFIFFPIVFKEAQMISYISPQQVIVELPPLLSEADLHIAQLTLLLLTSIARLQPQALSFVSNTILPETLNLAKSPLLQGNYLDFSSVFLPKNCILSVIILCGYSLSLRTRF